MPKIPFAYNLKNSQDMSVEDIQEFALVNGNMPGLACADENCRAEHPETRLTCACCDPEKPCSVQLPHLRTYPNHEHSEECRFGRLAEAYEYVMRHKDEFINHGPDRNIFKRLKRIDDASALPDEYVNEFCPRENVALIDREIDNLMQRGASRVQAERIAVCRVPEKTSRLSLIISAAEKLYEPLPGQDEKNRLDEAKSVRLALPGRSNSNYFSAFHKIYTLKESYNIPYILHDYATVHRKNDGFLIRYSYPLNDYREGMKGLTAVSFISDEELRGKGGATLRSSLEHYANSGKTCCVYSFSRHFLNENNCPDVAHNACVVIEFNTLGGIVIRPRCVNRSEKRKS